MIKNIVWSNLSEQQLDDIYEYYKNKVGTKIAKSLIKGIITSPNKLLKTPYIGQEELSLTYRKIKYRYLVYKNYKLIYSVDQSNGFIKIADVFDTRQNPIKMERTK
ncbi:MAG: type II toxin-antitoxin system RelE/ParE family toxin [Bacteroidetes bacterium HGW-Bacteroidetes-2]|jgi:plasmid stabilization system protein ParE|nr:MAG: type II toxin-antitoxin system RelE/ParE family toxin [Bacteroidetes bacterium HGW-Bacteroidetes-2]